MKGKDLLKGFGTIHPKYFEEAELTAPASPRRRFQKPLLIAAVIAMSLLLAGCAVAYVLSMQNLKVGQVEETKPVFATDGVHIEGYVPATYQELTLAGLKGSAGYRAALEWYDFKKNYDPDHVIQMTTYAEDTRPEFPREFEVYNLYSQEMKDKLDGILAKYSLKPVGQYLDFETTQNLCTALGIEKIQTAEDAASVRVKNGRAYENGNFCLDLDFSFPEDGNELSATWGQLLWNRKDCFSDDTITIEDTGDWQERNYTTANGNEVLIMRSESDWRGWIICDRPDATMSLMLEARRDLGNNVDGKTWWDHIYMTDKQLEQVADAIDFGIQPRVATKNDVANQEGFSLSSAPTQDGYTVKLKSFETDGELAYLTISITAPEGTDISHPSNPNEVYYIIQSSGSGGMTLTYPAQKQKVLAGYTLMPEEDGDGLDNTQDFIYKMDATGYGLTNAFGPGTCWTFRMEDLIHSYWDGTNIVDDVLAQGQWQFDISIGETDGDFREIELIKEPIKAQAMTGSKMDGTDVFEDREITSFTIRSLSATIVSDGSSSFSGRGDRHIFVVMKDGSQVELQGINGTIYAAASSIDVTQVDHVLLPDGTKLSANP